MSEGLGSSADADTQSAADTAVVADLPVPKYRIGQTLYYADTTRTTAKMECPDCRGTKVWLVKTATDVLETPCQRCCGGYMSRGHQDKLNLSYTVHEAVAHRFTPDNLEAKTKGYDGVPSVMYWSNKGGRNETDLHDTEEAALMIARVRAAALNAKEEATLERLEQRHIGTLKIDDALYDEFKNSLWQSWYRFRSLLEKITETIEGVDDETPLTPQQLKDLDDEIKWERSYYADQAHPMDDLVKAVHAALYTDGSLDKVETAFKALPAALQKPFVKPAERDWSLDWSPPTTAASDKLGGYAEGVKQGLQS